MPAAPDERSRSDARSVPGLPEQPDHQTGYQEFFTRYWRPVRLAVALRAADDRFVDDVVQEAFLLARHDWSRIRNYDKPEHWVITVAWRMLRKIQAKDRYRVSYVEPPAISDPSCIVVTNEQVYAAVRRLSRRQGEAIILQMLGYPVADSAKIMGVTPATVKTHLHLARNRLRKLLRAGAE
jgi:RNA polymerase sigma-70 factor (ECF subfamily)